MVCPYYVTRRCIQKKLRDPLGENIYERKSAGLLFSMVRAFHVPTIDDRSTGNSSSGSIFFFSFFFFRSAQSEQPFVTARRGNFHRMVGRVHHEISIRRNRQRAVNWSETWIRGGSALPRRSRKTRCIVLSTLSPISTPDTSLAPLPWPRDAPPPTTPRHFFFSFLFSPRIEVGRTRRFDLKTNVSH